MVSETIILSDVSWSVIGPHKFQLVALSVYYLRGNAFLVSSGGHQPLAGHTAGNVANQTESQLRFWSLISVESVLMFNSHCQLISKLLLQPLALRLQ